LARALQDRLARQAGADQAGVLHLRRILAVAEGQTRTEYAPPLGVSYEPLATILPARRKDSEQRSRFPPTWKNLNLDPGRPAHGNRLGCVTASVGNAP